MLSELWWDQFLQKLLVKASCKSWLDPCDSSRDTSAHPLTLGLILGIYEFWVSTTGQFSRVSEKASSANYNT